MVNLCGATVVAALSLLSYWDEGQLCQAPGSCGLARLNQFTIRYLLGRLTSG